MKLIYEENVISSVLSFSVKHLDAYFDLHVSSGFLKQRKRNVNVIILLNGLSSVQIPTTNIISRIIHK